MAKESISKLEYKSIEIINIKTERKRVEKNMQSVSDMQNNIKQPNILGVSPKKRKKMELLKTTKGLKYNI